MNTKMGKGQQGSSLILYLQGIYHIILRGKANIMAIKELEK